MKFYQSKKKKKITVCFLFWVIKFSCKLYYNVCVVLFSCTSVCWDFIINGGWGRVSSLVDITNTFAYALSTICQALCTIFIYVILFKQICIYRWITERWINLPKVTDIEISKASIGSQIPPNPKYNSVSATAPHCSSKTFLSTGCHKPEMVSCYFIDIPNFHQFLMSF